MDEATSSTPDIKIHGDPGAWICICKASSKSQGWMKSTKVLEIKGRGIVLQTTSEFRNQDGTLLHNTDALVFVPDATIQDFQ